jgi:hypothetical protein
MREYPAAHAYIYAGAMTYHFGKARLMEVANVKALEVCPEGKEYDPVSACLSKYG